MTTTLDPLMGTHERRVLELLEDGEPHSEEDLQRVARYAREWVRALREDGFLVVEEDGHFRLLRR